MSEVSKAKHQTRGDIQGLRALAVIVVVLYHSGVPYVSGGFVGVDFFFVLSGFLITLLLVRELDARGRISLRNFWGRRARRLLPAAALVLIATTLVAQRVLPLLDRKAVALDILFASVFSANWRFAQQQTDYLAADRDPSPVLHYWTLGVEEQFYAVWPLLIVAVSFAIGRFARGRSRSASHVPTKALGIVFGVIFVASLAYSIVETSRNQQYAFFGTPSRAWQLAAGALVALAVPRLARIGTGVRLSLGIIGFVLFAASVFMLKESGSVAGFVYPSWLALAPTTAAIMLVASSTGGQTVLSTALSWWPLQRIGDVSYSFYLWHWPVLVLGVMWNDGGTLRFRLVLVLGAFVLSIVTYLCIENPIRRATPLARRPLLSLVMGVVLVVAVVPGTRVLADVKPFEEVFASAAGSRDPIMVKPSLDSAADDTAGLEEIGCQVFYKVDEVPDRKRCTFGDLDSKRSVFVVGDSIGDSVFPAIEKAAEDNSWKVTAWTKRGCPIADVTRWGPNHAQWFAKCDTFRSRVLDKVIAAKPELVILGMSRGSTAHLQDRATGASLTGEVAYASAAAGLERTVRTFKRAGIKVALVEPPERTTFNTASCLAEKKYVDRCTFKPLAGKAVAATVAAEDSTIDYILINDRFCGETLCTPVVGNVLVYRDVLHFTKTFALTLSPLFAKAMQSDQSRG